MKKEIIKPFDLASYKNGAKIRTRDGHKVRIICTDAKDKEFPIIGLITNCDGDENVVYYTLEGKICVPKNTIDLVIVEEVEEPEFWSDNKGNTFNGFRINNVASISEVSNVPNTKLSYDVFAIKKQAKSALAMARISQIMANDIKNFGGVVTDEEWKERAVRKYCIYRTNNKIRTIYAYSDYYFLAFHTEEQMNLFLAKYRDLVKEYLMID